MGPLVTEFVEHVDVTKGGKDPTHETGFADSFLHGVEAGPYDSFGTDYTSDRAGHFPEKVVSSCDGFLACGYCMCNLLGGFETGIDQWYGDHPDAMLNARRKQSDFRKQALVRWTRHDLMRIPFRSAVWANDDDRRAKVFDKMPAGTGNSKDVCVCTDVAEYLKSRVVLKEKIHFYAHSANIFEHVGELHIFRV